jgi:hypothetical protein
VISQHWAVLATALPLAGFASYARDTLAGRARPDRVSWALWAAAPLIAFAAEVASRTSLQVALVTLALGTGPLCVLAASLAARGASWRLTRLDLACGGLSALALVLWAVTGRGDTAIALAIAADALAAAPTVAKSWTDPGSESPWTYLASGAGAGITLLAVPHETFAACGFPAYVVAVCAVIAALILVSRPVLRGAALALGGAAGISGVAVPAVMIADILSGPAPALLASAPPLGSIQDHTRPALTAISRPGVHHHRRHVRVRVSALLPLPPLPGSPAPLTARPSPPEPSPSRSRTPPPPGTSPQPYPSTTTATPSPSSTSPYPSASPSPYPTPSPSPSPTHAASATATPSPTYGG